MEFKNYDVQCDDFFKLLRQTEAIDYIVVALNSDEQNKRTAQDIKIHYERRDTIYPFVAVSEKNGCLHEDDIDERIFVFGCCEEIYKYAIVIREENDRLAKAFHETYRKMGYTKKQWFELDCFLQESNRAAADFIPAILYLVDPQLLKIEAAEMSAVATGILAETLAQTEHLRWNAFHVAMGYRSISIEEMRRRFDIYEDKQNSDMRLDFARRDTKAKLQVCLVHWDGLDAVSEAYKELKHLAGKEPRHDFKNNDRDNINNIPKILREVMVNSKLTSVGVL